MPIDNEAQAADTVEQDSSDHREQVTRWIAVGSLLLAVLSSVIALSQRNVAAEANALSQQANEAVQISHARTEAESALRELNEKIEEAVLDPDQPWVTEAYQHWVHAASLAS